LLDALDLQPLRRLRCVPRLVETAFQLLVLPWVEKSDLIGEDSPVSRSTDPQRPRAVPAASGPFLEADTGKDAETQEK
jgi:hypothetical protein